MCVCAKEEEEEARLTPGLSGSPTQGKSDSGSVSVVVVVVQNMRYKRNIPGRLNDDGGKGKLPTLGWEYCHHPVGDVSLSA